MKLKSSAGHVPIGPHVSPSRGTRQILTLTEVAARIGVARVTVKRWWSKGRLIGRASVRASRHRVCVPIEVVEFYQRQSRLPTKLDLFEAGVLGRDFLLELMGPDGGLSQTSAERL